AGLLLRRSAGVGARGRPSGGALAGRGRRRARGRLGGLRRLPPSPSRGRRRPARPRVPVVEERPAFAGPPRTPGGFGGHFGAPMFYSPPVTGHKTWRASF